MKFSHETELDSTGGSRSTGLMNIPLASGGCNATEDLHSWQPRNDPQVVGIRQVSGRDSTDRVGRIEGFTSSARQSDELAHCQDRHKVETLEPGSDCRKTG